jgi:hypothetical protein
LGVGKKSAAEYGHDYIEEKEVDFSMFVTK